MYQSMAVLSNCGYSLCGDVALWVGGSVLWLCHVAGGFIDIGIDSGWIEYETIRRLIDCVIVC